MGDGKGAEYLGVGGVEFLHPGAVVEPLLGRGLADGAAALVFAVEVNADAIDLEPAIGPIGGFVGVDEAGADDAAHNALITPAHDGAGVFDLDEAFFLDAFAGAQDGVILWRGWADEFAGSGW